MFAYEAETVRLSLQRPSVEDFKKPATAIKMTTTEVDWSHSDRKYPAVSFQQKDTPTI